uniref:Uncharacterized protein n=1 Tax=Anguilla anguilla TaxID=7936 RepID=A0A0E9UGJ6_ANGAN
MASGTKGPADGRNSHAHNVPTPRLAPSQRRAWSGAASKCSGTRFQGRFYGSIHADCTQAVK